MLGHIVIDDVTHPGDVESARRNVSRNHHFVFAALESFKRFDPFALGAIGMQDRDGVIALLQFVRHPIGVHFRSAKNQHAVELRSFKQRHEQIELLFGCHWINRVRDRFRRRTTHADFNQLWFAKNPFGKSLDFRWQSRREEKGLPIARNFFNDLTDLRQKSHVEHAIDLVENENVYIAKMERLLFEMIDQPPRCRDNDIDAAFQIVALLAVTDTAMHDGRPNVGEASVIAERGFDLCGQLARWFQNKTTKFPVMSEQGQDRQSERGGLAGTGLSGAD